MKRLARSLLAAAVAVAVVPPAQVTAQQPRYERHPERPANRPAIPGVNGLVTAGHPLASMAGMRILLEGGNAADAAVATLAALNVVRPQMSGIAGNGFFTIYENVSGQVFNLAATGAAPLALDASALTADQLNKGIKAGVVPGLFGGWVAILDRFGTMSLARVLEPAIEYAEHGHPIEESVVRSIESHVELFQRYASSRRTFLPKGRVPRPGEMFHMPDLANTLRKVVEAEDEALAGGQTRSQALLAAFERFYRGDIAEEMARFYRENGGDFTTEDFARYEPIWRKPVHTTYRGYDVYSSPPTSRGGLEVTMQLNLVEGFDLASRDRWDPVTLHMLAEAIKVAKADIYRYVADPLKFEVPSDALLSKAYASERRKLIDPSRVMAYPEHGSPAAGAAPQAAPPNEADERSYPGSTTSFSIMDRWGNVVACTPTHGGAFGTGVVVGNTGMTFNNGTRHGSTSPYPDDVNYARGGQIPILNNSPVIVLKDGRFHAAVGTPGGETIGQTQFQVLVNILDYDMGIQEAIAAPRFVLNAEPNFYRAGSQVTMAIEDRVTDATLAALEALGWTLRLAPGYSFGSMQGIRWDAEHGTMFAGADPRRMGYAIGW